jgi:predicted nucleic acid-binding protein
VRVVLDAGGADRRVDRSPRVCGQLLDAGRQEKIQIIISPQLLAELKLVLGREKFRRWLTEPEARHAAGAIARLGELHQDPPPQPGLTPDPKDDYLVTLALRHPSTT